VLQLGLLLLLLGATTAAAEAALAAARVADETAGDDLSRGDEAWAQRARGDRDGIPEPSSIRLAIAAYEAHLAAHPESLEARWKLLRALHFDADFVEPDADAKRRLLDHARDVAESGLDDLARELGSETRLERMDAEVLVLRLTNARISRNDVARLHFWSAICWGTWTRSVGLLEAVRDGVAGRLYRYVSVTLVLEPDYEDGGALRLLGRLHAELPRVPFVSGWVDRKQALPLIERARALAPGHPGNRLLLALTLLELAPGRRSEALDLLQGIASLSPREDMRIEDLAIRKAARARLADATGSGEAG
jgi:hypothetical protein